MKGHLALYIRYEHVKWESELCYLSERNHHYACDHFDFRGTRCFRLHFYTDHTKAMRELTSSIHIHYYGRCHWDIIFIRLILSYMLEHPSWWICISILYTIVSKKKWRDCPKCGALIVIWFGFCFSFVRLLHSWLIHNKSTNIFLLKLIFLKNNAFPFSEFLPVFCVSAPPVGRSWK